MTGLVNTEAEDNAFLNLDPNANLGVGFTSVPFEFKRVENFLPTNRGGLSKTFGFSLHKDVGSSTPITGLYRFIKSNGTSEFIVSYGTLVYKLVAGTLTSLVMTVANGPIDFETAYDKMIVCDGVNDPQTYDGTTVANLTTGADATAADGARQSVFHANRLFLFSATHDQSLLYYSDGGDITAGYATNFINCNVNDGQKITGICKFFIPGDIQPVIIVSKERSIGIVVGDGTATNPFTFVPIADDIGVPSFRQIVQFEQDAAFFTPQGVSSYVTTVQNNNIERRMISRNIRNQFTSIGASVMGNVLGWLDWKRRRVSYAIPTGASTYANTVWHYDIELKGWYKQTGFDVSAAFVDTDGFVYTGNSTGKIYKHDESVNNYDTAAIQGVIQTPYLDFFQPHYYKRIVNGRLILRGQGDYNLGVSCSLNNGQGTGSSHQAPVSGGSFLWNGGTWNNTGSYRWGSAPLTRNKFFPGGIFENISFTLSNSGMDQPVDFLEMILEVEYLNLI